MKEGTPMRFHQSLDGKGFDDSESIFDFIWLKWMIDSKKTIIAF